MQERGETGEKITETLPQPKDLLWINFITLT